MSRALLGKLAGLSGTTPRRTLRHDCVTRVVRAECLEDRCLFAVAVTPYNGNANGTPLADQLVLPNTGITVTSAVFVGANGQAGTFTGLDYTLPTGALTLEDGVLLTSGLATGAEGPNGNRGSLQVLDNESTGLGRAGDSDLAGVAQSPFTFDANSLTLTFTADANTRSILFDFIYGSEEFPEFVGAGVNDTFAAFLDGVQISFDPQRQPISVDNNFFQFNNSGLTTADDPNVAGKTPVNIDLEYDGLTPRIRTTAPLSSNVTTHTLKFVVGDVGDDILDSGVFLSRLQGSTAVVQAPVTGVPILGQLKFRVADYRISEDGNSVQLQVDRVGGTDSLATVDVTTADGTATAGQDYTPVTTTLTFAMGQQTQTVTIPILDDTLAEGDETFLVNLISPTGDVELTAPITATVTIVENEPGVRFSQRTYSVAEGTQQNESTAFITVERVGPADTPFTVRFSTANGTATEEDYQPVTQELAFAAGETSKVIAIPVYSDFEVEGTETVNLRLTQQTTPILVATSGGTDTATLEILDTERVFSISRSQFVTNAAGRIVGVALRFNRDLVRERAEDLNNYDLYEYRERRFGGAPARKRLTLASATYDAASKTVILTPAKRLKENQFYEVNANTSRESGIRSTTFETFDGDLNGFATPFAVTDDYVGYLARGHKFQYFDRDGDQVRLNLKGPGGMELFRLATRGADELRMLSTDGTNSVLTGDVKPNRDGGTDGKAVLDQLTGTPVRNELDPNEFQVRINRLGRS